MRIEAHLDVDVVALESQDAVTVGRPARRLVERQGSSRGAVDLVAGVCRPRQERTYDHQVSN